MGPIIISWHISIRLHPLRSMYRTDHTVRVPPVHRPVYILAYIGQGWVRAHSSMLSGTCVLVACSYYLRLTTPIILVARFLHDLPYSSTGVERLGS